MAYITCKDLTLGYEGNAVTEHVSFCVNKGDYLCIIGENGAGKSTLIKTLLGLIPPLKGQILTGDGALPGETGYLPQQTVVQRDFPATVWEIVLSGTLAGCGKRFFYTKKEKELALWNIRRMHIEDLCRKSYRNLSGGQQQRVLLARALCATGRLLLMDEPVAGLDPGATLDFYQTIRELNREGLSVIMVTHDMEAAMKEASHILHIGKKKHFFGTKQEYLESSMSRSFWEEGGQKDG